MKKISTIIKKSTATLALLALTLGSFGSTAIAQEVQYVVYFEAFVDGSMATAESANNADFDIDASIDGVASTQNYILSDQGYEGDPTPYQAYHSHLNAGSDLSATFVVDGTVVGANCDANAQFSFAGYTTGSTYGAAAGGTPSLTAPTLTDVSSDNVIIAWLNDCEEEENTVNVNIHKFVDGAHATASNADNAEFMMDSSYVVDGETTQAGFALNENIASGSNHAYHMISIDLPVGSDYTTSEVLDGTISGANCDADADFSLTGYTSGNTLAEAQAGTVSLTAISLTNLTVDKHIIVWNETCDDEVGDGTEGEIGGDVIAGPGVLTVTSVEITDNTATADGTFTNGWKYVFNVTVPTNETEVSMKFADWTKTGGGGTIATANHVRISSTQADNSGATVLLTAANTYSSPTLNMTGDLDSGVDGKQVKVTVEVAVPAGSVNGSYTTQYGIKTE